MPDIYSPARRSEIMAKIRGADTEPELSVRRTHWRMGARYRLHRSDLPGRPDIVIAKRRLTIFVHGAAVSPL